ncbi:MAG: hypothetical protein M0Z41_20910 [Peptococcaceae bacterium]|jgi:mannose-6-phosphate isomerase-like protein (cupin superfamily)|nr:hypothetical protein [Peptococcaceae bacterium]
MNPTPEGWLKPWASARLFGETLELLPKRCYTVPRKVLHRTRAGEKTIVLMVEGNTVNPRGD